MTKKGICFLIILTTNLFSLSGNLGMRGVSIYFVGKDKINNLTRNIKLNYQRNQNMKKGTPMPIPLGGTLSGLLGAYSKFYLNLLQF